jgi:hypothetical protein
MHITVDYAVYFLDTYEHKVATFYDVMNSHPFTGRTATKVYVCAVV